MARAKQFGRTTEVAFGWTIGVDPTSGRTRLACASTDLPEEEAAGACARLDALRPDGIHDLSGTIGQRFLAGLQDVKDLAFSAVADILLETVPDPAGRPTRPSRARLAMALGEGSRDHDPVAAIAELAAGLGRRDPSTLKRAFDPLRDAEAFAQAAIDRRGDIADRLGSIDPHAFVQAAIDAGIGFALRAHSDAWGRRHRQIGVTVADERGAPPMAGLTSRSQARHTYGPFDVQGCWEAWRHGATPRLGNADRHAPTLFCKAVSALAIPLHGGAGDGVAGSDGSLSRSMLDLHYCGDLPPSAHIVDWHFKGLWRMVEPISARDTCFALAADQAGREPLTLRLARLLEGNEPAICRDRLMCKMLGRGLGAGALIPMRLDALRVDAIDDVYDHGWSDDVPVYSMDSEDAADFWTLVRANATLGGFLFAPSDDLYGSRALDEAGIHASLASRCGELLEGAAAMIAA